MTSEDRILTFAERLKAEKAAAQAAAIRAGTLCGTCADEGERTCDCWKRLAEGEEA